MVIDNKITIVTGLWDIKRHELTEGWSRSYEEHYIEKFAKLLEIPYNLIIFGDKELKEFVFKYRKRKILNLLLDLRVGLRGSSTIKYKK